MLVVGTYQYTLSYRRSYSFFFNDARDEARNQVLAVRKKGETAFPPESADGSEVTIGFWTIVSSRFLH